MFRLEKLLSSSAYLHAECAGGVRPLAGSGDYWRPGALLCFDARSGDRNRTHRRHRMDDKTTLLNQLRIDRGSTPAPSGKGWIWLVVAAVIVAAAALAAWWWTRPGAAPVHVAAAQAIAGDGAAAAGSI